MKKRSLITTTALLASAAFALGQGIEIPWEYGIRLVPTSDGSTQAVWSGPGTLEISSNMTTWQAQAAVQAAPQQNAVMIAPQATSERMFARVRQPDGSTTEAVELMPALQAGSTPVIDPLPIFMMGFDGVRMNFSVKAKPGTGGATPSRILPYRTATGYTLIYDDGTHGDATAGDGTYAGQLPATVAEIQKSINVINQIPPTMRQPVKFDRANRSMTTETWNLNDSKAKLEAVLAGQSVEGPIMLGFSPTQALASAGGDLSSGRTTRSPGSLGSFPAWQKTLLITDLTVVEDPVRTFDPTTGAGTPGGAWTFGTLMTAMANQPRTGITPSDFARRWLRTWATAQTINGDVVPARSAIISRILNTWQTASGGASVPLDMNQAPFRLCAIVNRLDLRSTSGGYAPPAPGAPLDPCDNHTGEGRFVFSYCGHASVPTSMNPALSQPFLVIMEYGVPKSSILDLQKYACEWAALEPIPFGPTYNDALQAITDQFTRENEAPLKANGSALNQLRTNEFIASPWQCREFRITQGASSIAPGHLNPSTVKQTPQGSLDGSAQLSDFVLNSNVPSHVVPLEWRTSASSGVKTAFLGGKSDMAPINGVSAQSWGTTGSNIISNPVRHQFALQTCSGCHHRETAANFTHVSARMPGATSMLSTFLVGNAGAVSVPGSPAMSASFADVVRREQDLMHFINTPSFFLTLFGDPLALGECAVH